MKRSKQGYVMALVLVVMLLLTSVASVVAATSVRNIESGGASFMQEQARIQAESSSREQAVNLNKAFYDYLMEWEPETAVPDVKDSDVFFWDQLVSYAEGYDSYPGPAGSLKIEIPPLGEPTAEPKKKFTVSVSTSLDGQTVTAEIQIMVDYEGPLHPIDPDAPVDPEEEPKPRTVTVTSVEYTSYSIL